MFSIFLRINSSVINLMKIESFSLDSDKILFDMDSGYQKIVEFDNEKMAKIVYENLCKSLVNNGVKIDEQPLNNTKH